MDVNERGRGCAGPTPSQPRMSDGLPGARRFVSMPTLSNVAAKPKSVQEDHLQTNTRYRPGSCLI